MRLLSLFVSTLVLSMLPSFVWAFDDDREINDPDFDKEAFLDIKSYQFSKLRDWEWDETLNGFRLQEGSLNLDFSYLVIEGRVRQPITERITVSYRGKQEQFYAIKPIRQEAEAQLRVWGNWHIALFGFPTYDKRVGDFGTALIWGQPPWNYVRVARIQQEILYNDKNFENDEYIEEPVEDQIEGAYASDRLKVRFQGTISHPAEQFFPDDQLTFEHQSEESSWEIRYRFPKDQWFGWKARSFDIFKSRASPVSEEAEDNQRQTLQFISSDFYWVLPNLDQFTLTTGLQYDVFRNRLRDSQDTNNSFDYRFETLQAYATLLHPWDETLDLEYGVYAGDVTEARNRLTESVDDKFGRQIEAKARFSAEWHSIKGNARLLVVTSWNLDDLADTPWDGGGVSIMMSF